jgi:hypothetical protein
VIFHRSGKLEVFDVVVAVDPRLLTKAGDSVRVAQALDRGLSGCFFMAENVMVFQPPENLTTH